MLKYLKHFISKRWELKWLLLLSPLWKKGYAHTQLRVSTDKYAVDKLEGNYVSFGRPNCYWLKCYINKLGNFEFISGRSIPLLHRIFGTAIIIQVPHRLPCHTNTVGWDSRIRILEPFCPIFSGFELSSYSFNTLKMVQPTLSDEIWSPPINNWIANHINTSVH